MRNWNREWTRIDANGGKAEGWMLNFEWGEGKVGQAGLIGGGLAQFTGGTPVPLSGAELGEMVDGDKNVAATGRACDRDGHATGRGVGWAVGKPPPRGGMRPGRSRHWARGRLGGWETAATRGMRPGRSRHWARGRLGGWETAATGGRRLRVGLPLLGKGGTT